MLHVHVFIFSISGLRKINISKHNPNNIGDDMIDNNRVVFNNNIYDSDYEEEEKKEIEPQEWKRKIIYNAGVEDGKFEGKLEGDKEDYMKDVFENYLPIKKIMLY